MSHPARVSTRLAPLSALATIVTLVATPSLDAQVGRSVGVRDANIVAEAEMATMPGMNADLAKACLIVIGPCMHAGQGCAMPTRMLLPRSRYAEGVAILENIYRSIAPGATRVRY